VRWCSAAGNSWVARPMSGRSSWSRFGRGHEGAGAVAWRRGSTRVAAPGAGATSTSGSLPASWSVTPLGSPVLWPHGGRGALRPPRQLVHPGVRGSHRPRRHLSVHAGCAARRHAVSWRAVDHLCIQVAREALGRVDLLSGPVASAFDEVKYKKGQCSGWSSATT